MACRTRRRNDRKTSKSEGGEGRKEVSIRLRRLAVSGDLCHLHHIQIALPTLPLRALAHQLH